MPLPKNIADVFAKKERFLKDSENKMDSDVIKLQTKLLTLILSEYAPLFDTDSEGNLKQTDKNLRLINQLEKTFDKFSETFNKDMMKGFANDLLKIVPLSANYFKAQGIKSDIVDKAADQESFIKKIIGVDEDNKLIKGGYLDSLSKYQSVKLKLQNYVVSSISTGKDLKSFTRGFKTLIEGKKRVDGIMSGYYRTYAHDKFFEVDAIVNKTMADNLGLKYFIYEGDLIESSRQFCIKRAGKVYSVEETKTWKDDPDLIDQKTKDTYNPLIERGRYNCRHFIKYISQPLAFRLRPDLKPAA